MKIIKMVKKYFDPDCVEKIIEKTRKMISLHDVLIFSKV